VCRRAPVFRNATRPAILCSIRSRMSVKEVKNGGHHQGHHAGVIGFHLVVFELKIPLDIQSRIKRLPLYRWQRQCALAHHHGLFVQHDLQNVDHILFAEFESVLRFGRYCGLCFAAISG
jgi:hypothetical protein